ncbi:hypothetical protein AcV5_008011 [Taiwanofungus camphoratus]|nr:hypothetical protein AcV5_008011 [Antrodia cinnamomea]
MSFTQYFEEVAGAARAAPIAIMVSVAATKLALPMGQLLLDVLGKRVPVWRCTRRRRVLRICTRQCTAWVALVEASESVHPDARQRRLVMILAAICGLLGFSATAFSSLVGASVIGLCTSYATLIFLRITSGRRGDGHRCIHRIRLVSARK